MYDEYFEFCITNKCDHNITHYDLCPFKIIIIIIITTRTLYIFLKQLFFFLLLLSSSTRLIQFNKYYKNDSYYLTYELCTNSYYVYKQLKWNIILIKLILNDRVTFKNNFRFKNNGSILHNTSCRFKIQILFI